MMIKIEALLKKGATIRAIRARLTQQYNRKEQAAVIVERLPQAVRETIRKADEALAGKLLLPGTGGVPKFVGNPPNWLVKMNDDNEFLWQLNRMDHWIVLLEAYAYTNNPVYGEKVLAEFKDWHQQMQLLERNFSMEPLGYFSQVHPFRILECGIRLYKTWPMIIAYLIDSPLLTDELLTMYLSSIHKQAELLARVSPQLWPLADHNHYLMECLGLYTTALMVPEFKESDTWKQQGFHELERCSQSQLTAAGGQIEGCPSYHNGCMFWFSLVMVLASKAGSEVSPEFKQRLKNNLDYALQSMRPTGTTYPLGDSHSNNLAIMSGVYGYFALKDDYWLRHLCAFLPITEIQQTAYHYLRNAEEPQAFIDMLETLAPLPAADLLPTTFFNRQLGQAFVRSDWSKEAQAFAFTCRSPIQNLHAHIDLLSFEYIALGKNIICDPGFYTYQNSPVRKEFKSAAAHSTVMLDDRDFFEYISSWEYGKQQKGELTSLEVTDTAVSASGYHLSYQPVEIMRTLLLMAQDFLVVIDTIQGEAAGHLSRTFHLDYIRIEEGPGCMIGKSETINVKLVNFPEQAVVVKPGKLSDTSDIFRESRKIIYSDDQPHTHYLTVICPYPQDQVEPIIDIRQNDTGQMIVTKDGKDYQVILPDVR